MSTLKTDNIVNVAGNGPPTLTNGINVTGTASATTVAATTVTATTVTATGVVTGSSFAGSGAALTGISTEPHKYVSMANKNYVVTVASVDGVNMFYLDGLLKPTLNFFKTQVYVFDVSNSSNSGHPLVFKTSGSVAYTTGVVVSGTAGQAGAKVTITVAASAPLALLYSCSVHGNIMGNTITVAAQGTMDVGTFNFFDNKTLTANTTASFSNVPTNAKWQYSFKVGNIGQYDIANLTYVKSMGGGAYGGNLHGIYISDDGLWLTIVLKDSNYIASYTLPTAWDIAGGSPQSFYNCGNEETNPTGVSYKTDGTKMFMCGHSSDKCFVYNLSTAWQLNTAVKSSDEFYLGSQDSIPQEIYFRPDGLKMYMVGYTNKRIYEYNLSTAWDITTCVYSNKSFYLSPQGNDPESAAFDPTGTKLYTMEATGKTINQYELSTAWDISTTVFTKSVAVTTDTVPVGLYVKPDGTKLFISGDTTNTVIQYDMGSETTVTMPSSVKGTPTTPTGGKRVTYDFITSDGGTTVDLIAENII